MSEPFKLVVAGSRTIHDYDVVYDAIVESPFWPIHGGEIVSGGADGVDSSAERFYTEAKADFNLSFREFEPGWEKHGDSAGPRRNKRMVEYGDALIAVWNGRSNGTRDTINKALDIGLSTYVCVVGENKKLDTYV